jgi:hypothetical protein
MQTMCWRKRVSYALSVRKYDFGDSWEHVILVEKILPPEPGVKYPVCLTGRGACPPEDGVGCGATLGSLRPWPTPRTTSTRCIWNGLGGV